MVAKIQDQLIACVALDSEDSGIYEIKKRYTKEYKEHIGITKIMLQLLIKRARKAGCQKLRHSLPADWSDTKNALSEVGFTPFYFSLNSSENGLLTMELSMEA